LLPPELFHHMNQILLHSIRNINLRLQVVFSKTTTSLFFVPESLLFMINNDEVAPSSFSEWKKILNPFLETEIASNPFLGFEAIFLEAHTLI
jgi:hypothetical protein